MLHVMETTSKGWKHVGILVDDEASVYTPPAPVPAPYTPPPAPPTVMGWNVGDCHTFSKEGKTILNQQLWQAGFRWTANMRCSTPQRYRNGRVERFEIVHYSQHDIATRVS